MSAAGQPPDKRKKISIESFLVYATVAVFILIAAVAVVSSYDLHGVRNYSTTMLNEYFPKVLEHQRTSINLERLRRSAEVVLMATDVDMRRRAMVDAQALSLDSAFELDQAVHQKILEAVALIKEMDVLRGTGNKLLEENHARQQTLARADHTFVVAVFGSLDDKLLALEEKLIKLAFSVPDAKTGSALAEERAKIDALRDLSVSVRPNCQQYRPEVCASLEDAMALMQDLYDTQVAIAECDAAAYRLWEKADAILRELSDNLSSASSVTVVRVLNDIIAKTTDAAYRNYISMAVIFIIVIGLLFSVRRFIAQPVSKTAQAISSIRAGKSFAAPPASAISEIDDLNNVLIDFSRYMSEVMEKSKLLKDENQKLEDLSFKDGLTSIYNRRYFNIALQREWSRAKRSRVGVTVLMLDVDFFKKYNDALGHIVGDSCLVSIAKAITASMLRPNDIVARYGGEEFVMLIQDVDLQGALTVAERVHKNIGELHLTHPDSSISPYITVSIGVATYVPMYYDPPELLLEQADIALYRAKKEGRNRTCVYAPEETP